MTTLNKLALVAILAVAAGAQTPCVTQAFYDAMLLTRTQQTNALQGQVAALQAQVGVLQAQLAASQVQVTALQAAAAPFASITACPSCMAAIAGNYTIVTANWTNNAMSAVPPVPLATIGTYQWQFMVMTQAPAP